MTNMSRETLGRRIARMRLQHGMTQERLANIANVSAQAVSKWENDQSYPDILLLPLLATTFGVTVDELLGVEAITQARYVAPQPIPAAQPPVSIGDTAEAPVVEVPDTAAKAKPVPAPDPEPEPEPVPEPDPEPVPEPEPDSEPAPEPEPEPEPEVEFVAAPATEPEPEPKLDLDEPASRIRIRVVRRGKDAVNLSLPLAAARIVSNVMGYVPERIIEGVDLVGLADAALNAGKGTLVDVDDGNDRVVITLE